MANPQTPEDWLKLRQEETAAAIEQVIKEVAGSAANTEKALLPYQQRAVLLVDSGTNVLVIEKSRRIGLTWGLAAAAVLRASRSRKARGMDVLYISYAQEMTREFIDACAMWAKAFSIAASAAEEFLFDDEKTGEETRSIQAFRIRFASGFEIVGLSSAPRTLRGKQGLAIIDEAAFVDSLPELLKAALAFLMWGGQVVICSTHNGVDNPFNELVQGIRSERHKYELMRIDFDDALKDGLFKRICLVKGDEWSAGKEAAWRESIVDFYGDGADEELFCVPSQGSGAWLSTELIESRMTLPAERHILRWQWPADYLSWSDNRQQVHLREKLAELTVALSGLDQRHRHSLGFDFGRVVDLSEVTLMDQDEVLSRRTPLILELRNVPHEEQFAIVDHIWKALQRRGGAAFDATGAGGYVAEAMSRRYGKYDPKDEQGGAIAEIKFSVDWYRLNMPRVKAGFEDGIIHLPKDAELLGDLRAVKVKKGVAQIPDVRTGTRGLKRHGDFAVSLALAWYASLMNVAEYGYESAAGANAQGRNDTWDTPYDQRASLAPETAWREPKGRALKGTI